MFAEGGVVMQSDTKPGSRFSRGRLLQHSGDLHLAGSAFLPQTKSLGQGTGLTLPGFRSGLRGGCFLS